MRKREHVQKPVEALLAAAILAGTISTSLRADTPLTWGDIAGARLDLPASVAVPLMTFRYGDGPDELPLRYGDDPMETVVAAFQVDERESVWILTAGGPGCDTLRHFVVSSGEAVRDRFIPLPYCFSGFMVRPEGIYLSGLTGRGATQFSLLTPDGALRRLSLVRGWAKESRWFSSVGKLREVDGACYACLSEDCVGIGSRSSPDTLDGGDFLGGLPARHGARIWRSGRVIMRGTTPVLDLGENDRRYLWDVIDGGFVVGRANVYAGGARARSAEIYAENGELLRSFVIPTPAGQYGIGEGGDCVFTREHAYYLDLDRRAAALLRY
jgi:hypothetical protein